MYSGSKDQAPVAMTRNTRWSSWLAELTASPPIVPMKDILHGWPTSQAQPRVSPRRNSGLVGVGSNELQGSRGVALVGTELFSCQLNNSVASLDIAFSLCERRWK